MRIFKSLSTAQKEPTKFFFVLFALGLSASAHSASLSTEIKNTLKKGFAPDVIIELNDLELPTNGDLVLLSDQGNGKATLRIETDDDFENREIHYTAHLPVILPQQKIFSQQPLSSELFILSTVDVTKGYYRDIQNQLVTSLREINNKITVATLSPPLPIFKTQLRNPSLIKRGEHVSLRIESAGLVITASGVAQDEAQSGESVRVLTAQKRDLVGKAIGAGLVEVKL